MTTDHNPKKYSSLLPERVARFISRIISCGIALMTGLSSYAQTPAPVPSDFTSAKTAFIANAGVPTLGPKEKVAVSIMYNSLYRQLTTWNKYQLVASPRDADLALEISIREFVGTVSFGSSLSTTYIRLDARDAKTHALLWTIDDPISGAYREKTFRHNVDQAVTLVVEDLKALAAGKQPGSASDITPSTQP